MPFSAIFCPFSFGSKLLAGRRDNEFCSCLLGVGRNEVVGIGIYHDSFDALERSEPQKSRCVNLRGVHEHVGLVRAV